MMGDNNRAVLFASWITKQFPRCRTVLDVAGGGGHLAMHLSAYGYDVTLIDPKARLRLPSSKFRRAARRVRVIRKPLSGDAPAADLIVGMHPDEATQLIVELARDRRMCFAVVPCCVMPQGSHSLEKMSEGRWCEWLQRIARPLATRSTTLGMRGRNTVIWGWPEPPQ